MLRNVWYYRVAMEPKEIQNEDRALAVIAVLIVCGAWIGYAFMIMKNNTYVPAECSCHGYSLLRTSIQTVSVCDSTNGDGSCVSTTNVATLQTDYSLACVAHNSQDTLNFTVYDTYIADNLTTIHYIETERLAHVASCVISSHNSVLWNNPLVGWVIAVGIFISLYTVVTPFAFLDAYLFSRTKTGIAPRPIVELSPGASAPGPDKPIQSGILSSASAMDGPGQSSLSTDGPNASAMLDGPGQSFLPTDGPGQSFLLMGGPAKMPAASAPNAEEEVVLPGHAPPPYSEESSEVRLDVKNGIEPSPSQLAG